MQNFKASAEKPIYGLLNVADNRFYLIEEDYSAIKLVQHLLVNQYFFSCVEFSSDLPFSRPEMNDRGCSKPVTKNSRPDVKFATAVDNYFVDRPIGEGDANLLLNLNFLYKSLVRINYVFDSMAKLEQDHHDLQIKGLKEFKKFITMTMPEDRAGLDIADQEIKMYEEVIHRFDYVKSSIIKALMIPDYSVPIKHVKECLARNINKEFTFENASYKRVIQNLLNELIS